MELDVESHRLGNQALLGNPDVMWGQRDLLRKSEQKRHHSSKRDENLLQHATTRVVIVWLWLLFANHVKGFSLVDVGRKVTE